MARFCWCFDHVSLVTSIRSLKPGFHRPNLTLPPHILCQIRVRTLNGTLGKATIRGNMSGCRDGLTFTSAEA